MGFSCHSLSTLIFYHRMSQKSMGNVAQKRENYKRFICVVCLLTNCWGCGIIEISRAWAVGARLKIERGRRGKRRNPSAITMNTLALHSIHRWRTKSQPFAVKRKEVACGSRDIRDIVSACTVWFTFVFRTPTPRAVEDFIVKGLSDSRGSCHLAGFCLASLICILIISHFW